MYEYQTRLKMQAKNCRAGQSTLMDLKSNNGGKQLTVAASQIFLVHFHIFSSNLTRVRRIAYKM